MPDRDLPSFDCYRALGVPVTATVDEIEAAFRAAAKREHPDLSPDPTAATLRMQRLNVARDWLTDTDRRARYDAARGVRPAAADRRPDVTSDASAGPDPWPTESPAEPRGSMAGPIIASIALMMVLAMIFVGTGSIVTSVLLVVSIVALIAGVALTIAGAAR